MIIYCCNDEIIFQSYMMWGLFVWDLRLGDSTLVHTRLGYITNNAGCSEKKDIALFHAPGCPYYPTF